MEKDNKNYKQCGSVMFYSLAEDSYSDRNFDLIDNLIKYIDVEHTNSQWLFTLLIVSWWPESEGIILPHRQEFFDKCMAKFKTEMSEEEAEKIFRRYEPGHK